MHDRRACPRVRCAADSDQTDRVEEALRLFAIWGVPEDWVVDLVKRVVVVHRDPSEDGFGEVRTVSEGVLPLPAIDAAIAVGDLLWTPA